MLDIHFWNMIITDKVAIVYAEVANQNRILKLNISICMNECMIINFYWPAAVERLIENYVWT